MKNRSHKMEVNLTLKVPFSNEEPVNVTVKYDITIETLLNRAIHIFNSLANIKSFDILILLIDGTYQFTTTDDTLGMYNLYKNPEAIFVPKEFDIEITPETESTPIKMTVKNDETVEKIIERVCKQKGSLKPKHYCLMHDDVVLVNALSIVEQRPQAHKLMLYENTSPKVQLNFKELYLRGPVFLSLSDAQQLSAYLLQATQGPFRCFKGSDSSLRKFLPKCFRDAEHGSEELQVQWSFLSDCTREEATHKFTDNVQKLPLFNCTSFTCQAVKGDTTLPKEFELIFTETRIIFLDKMKFKTKISITYDNLIKVTRNEDEIEFTYTDDGKSIKNVKLETETSRSLITKCIELAVSAEALSQVSLESENLSYDFHTLEQINKDENRLKLFNTDFLYKFLNLDETDDRISYVEVMQAVALRAESCSFHLSVLFSKVNANNAKSYKQEITEYYIRLMAYLTYMTYDHRPFDAAYPIAGYIQSLETDFQKANTAIQNVVRMVHVVNSMFDPISKNQIYVISYTTKAYVLNHLLSITEFPYATEGLSPEPFEDVRSKFYDNALNLKELIKKYLFSVGSIDIKRRLQESIDLAFKLHLSTLSLMPLIIKSSDIGQLNPTYIMHQDSCNMMMNYIVEFSRILWEDRKQLSDEQVASFLQQAAELARQLLVEGQKYDMHVKSIQEFLKVVDLNIGSLKTRLRTYFYPFKLYSERFVSKYDSIQNLDLPHMKFRLLRCASILVVAQPVVLKPFIKPVIEQLNDLARELYKHAMKELPSFDLLPDEIYDDNNAVLRAIINDKLVPESDSLPIDTIKATELLQKFQPVLALQRSTGRIASEWAPFLAHDVLWLTCFVEAVSNSAFNSTGLKDDNFDVYGAWLPHVNNEALNNLIEQRSAEIESQENGAAVLEILKACNSKDNYYSLPEMNSHEQIKIVLDSTSYLTQISFNNVSLLLNKDLWSAMSSIPQMYFCEQLMLNAVNQTINHPTYFTLPPLYFEMQNNLATLSEGTKSFFMSGKANNVFIKNVLLVNEELKHIKPVVRSTDLITLYPPEQFDLPATINKDFPVERREDVADVICEYRILKNELVDCILLHEKENIQVAVGRINNCISHIVAIESNYNPANNNEQKIQEGYTSFIQALPRIYTYKLSILALRESLDGLDNAVDLAIDDIASHVYETVEPEKLNNLAEAVEKAAYEPSERSEFAKSFSEAIKGDLSEIKDENEMQILNELLLLLQDNKIAEMKYLASTLPEEKSEPLVTAINESKYANYVKKIEKSAELVLYDDELPVWYKDGVKNIVDALKAQNSNVDAVGAVDELTKVENVESPCTSDSQLFHSIDDASSKLTLKELQDLKEESTKVQANLQKIENELKQFDGQLAANIEYKGCAILYKDSIKSIVRYFYKEFSLQDWDPETFSQICQQSLTPLKKKFTTESVANSLLALRRHLRMIRLIKPTAHPNFVSRCDHMLTEAEESLRDFFNGNEKARIALIEKQREIVKAVEQEFSQLPDSNLRIFMSHLIHNVYLDLDNGKQFNATKFAREIRPIEKEFNLNKIRLNQIHAVLNWVQKIDRDALPIDNDHLISILRKLLETLTNVTDDRLFEYDQDVLMDMAIRLSEALGKLSDVKYSLFLVKDMHDLYSIRETLITFVETIVRMLEAYAEEIPSFPIEKHPILGILETTPKMCDKLEVLIESSFMLSLTKRHVEEASQSIKDFYESCPDDVKENIQAAIQEPIQAIESLDAK